MTTSADVERLVARKGWPVTGTLLRVRVAGRMAGSLVLEADTMTVRLAPPSAVVDGKAVPATAAPGSGLVLYWDQPAGRYSLPAVLEQSDEDGWRVRPAGRPTVQQRRETVREEVRLPLVLEVGGTALPGRVVDLSESGLRAVLSEAPVGVSCAVARFTLDGHDLAVPVDLLRTSPLGTGRWEVAGCFRHTPRDADLIRRFVFARQRRARAGGL